ncbi:hypothetical protein QUA62_26100 [Microcoleus sp. MON1_C1]|uniref:hypothetical protein n=1 Tax=Microcoleus sp. MON1_C1 TaxID=2818827 RepID=UPI002FD660FD
MRAQIFEAWVQRDELALFEYQQKGIAAVESDVTLQTKSSQNQGSSDLTSKSASVTAPSINKEEMSSVTTNSTIRTLSERTETQPIGRLGWVQRWGKWVRASFLAATDGSQYRILIEEVGGWSEVLAFSDQTRWEGGPPC